MDNQRSNTEVETVFPKYILESRRRSGNSTRQIDAIIQSIFEGRTVAIADHHGTDEANEYLTKRVTDRLFHEHGLMKDRELEIKRRNIHNGIKYTTIKLK